MNKLFNKELKAAGSSGSADAAPRMTKNKQYAAPRMTEYGRSMVEMLGVLAIVGVLSVGGIAGYTSAMRSYRANEIVNATSMLYMLGIAQNQGAGDAQMVYSTHFGANAVPSGASEITYNADKTIRLDIPDFDICHQVKNKLGDKVIAGDCATFPYITIRFEKVASSTTPEQQNCSQCSVNGGSCSGTNCSGCIVPVVGYINGTTCVLRATCNKICSGNCYDDAYEDIFEVCCANSPSTDKKGCPSS